MKIHIIFNIRQASTFALDITGGNAMYQATLSRECCFVLIQSYIVHDLNSCNLRRAPRHQPHPITVYIYLP